MIRQRLKHIYIYIDADQLPNKYGSVGGAKWARITVKCKRKTKEYAKRRGEKYCIAFSSRVEVASKQKSTLSLSFFVSVEDSNLESVKNTSFFHQKKKLYCILDVLDGRSITFTSIIQRSSPITVAHPAPARPVPLRYTAASLLSFPRHAFSPVVW